MNKYEEYIEERVKFLLKHRDAFGMYSKDAYFYAKSALNFGYDFDLISIEYFSKTFDKLEKVLYSKRLR